MSLIQVTPDYLTGKASDVRLLRSEHEQTMQLMTRLVDSLGDIWKGDAQNAFLMKYRSMNVTFRNFSELLESYAMLMDTAAVRLQNTDHMLKTTMQNL